MLEHSFINDNKNDFQKFYPQVLQQQLSHILERQKQIIHDIQSPLMVLHTFLVHSTNLKDDTKNGIKSAISRLIEIVRDLNEETATSQSNKVSIQDITTLVRKIISEKQIEYKHFKDIQFLLKDDQPHLSKLAKVSSGDFKRILSNLINNSVEALIGQTGQIVVELCITENFIVIQIKDTGRGIAHDKISQITTNGYSYNKPQGSGLGLFHAKSKIEEWGGDLVIESQLGLGTVVSIKLPKIIADKKLNVSNPFRKYASYEYILIDDDMMVRNCWQKVADIQGLHIGIFDSPDIFFEQIDSIHNDVPIFIDSKLSDSVSGETIAKEIYDRGFEKIYITTGYDKKEFCDLPWIKGVIGKKPPFL